MSDLFNLEQFRQDVRLFSLALTGARTATRASLMRSVRSQTGTLVLELSDVKRFDLEHKKTKREEVGCFHGQNWAEQGVRPLSFDNLASRAPDSRLRRRSQRTFEAFNLDAPSWNVERLGGWANDATESFILFDMDTDLRLKKTQAFAAKENRDVPRNMRDSQLLCAGNIWSLSDVSMYREGWGPHNYLVADGLQEKEGGMAEMLSPEHRGTHPGALEPLLPPPTSSRLTRAPRARRMVGRWSVPRLSAGDLGRRPCRRSQDARRGRPSSRPPHGPHPARRLCCASSLVSLSLPVRVGD